MVIVIAKMGIKIRIAMNVIQDFLNQIQLIMKKHALVFYRNLFINSLRNDDFYNSILGCKCNMLGSTTADYSDCVDKCCNEGGSCTCIMGYSGSDCNDCIVGHYYVSATVNGENTCTGEWKNKILSIS